MVRSEKEVYYMTQGRHKVWKFEGACSTVVGIICPPGWDRVNCSAKHWGGWSPQSRPLATALRDSRVHDIYANCTGRCRIMTRSEPGDRYLIQSICHYFCLSFVSYLTIFSWFYLRFLTSCDDLLHTYILFFVPDFINMGVSKINFLHVRAVFHKGNYFSAL